MKLHKENVWNKFGQAGSCSTVFWAHVLLVMGLIFRNSLIKIGHGVSCTYAPACQGIYAAPDNGKQFSLNFKALDENAARKTILFFVLQSNLLMKSTSVFDDTVERTGIDRLRLVGYLFYNLDNLYQGGKENGSGYYANGYFQKQLENFQ